MPTAMGSAMRCAVIGCAWHAQAQVCCVKPNRFGATVKKICRKADRIDDRQTQTDLGEVKYTKTWLTQAAVCFYPHGCISEEFHG
ncbi:hypothetical protein [Comamonas sp. lk]|uniref:hypothetical protein n=1 Tax=Comamonas sp. lk TaxID=2201272 RepID=UPI0013CF2562|nr:hypothetical protein [Comamonas sp. lk]